MAKNNLPMDDHDGATNRKLRRRSNDLPSGRSSITQMVSPTCPEKSYPRRGNFACNHIINYVEDIKVMEFDTFDDMVSYDIYCQQNNNFCYASFLQKEEIFKGFTDENYQAALEKYNKYLTFKTKALSPSSPSKNCTKHKIKTCIVQLDRIPLPDTSDSSDSDSASVSSKKNLTCKIATKKLFHVYESHNERFVVPCRTEGTCQNHNLCFSKYNNFSIFLQLIISNGKMSVFAIKYLERLQEQSNISQLMATIAASAASPTPTSIYLRADLRLVKEILSDLGVAHTKQATCNMQSASQLNPKPVIHNPKDDTCSASDTSRTTFLGDTQYTSQSCPKSEIDCTNTDTSEQSNLFASDTSRTSSGDTRSQSRLMPEIDCCNTDTCSEQPNVLASETSRITSNIEYPAPDFHSPDGIFTECQNVLTPDTQVNSKLSMYAGKENQGPTSISPRKRTNSIIDSRSCDSGIFLESNSMDTHNSDPNMESMNDKETQDSTSPRKRAHFMNGEYENDQNFPSKLNGLIESTSMDLCDAELKDPQIINRYKCDYTNAHEDHSYLFSTTSNRLGQNCNKPLDPPGPSLKSPKDDGKSESDQSKYDSQTSARTRPFATASSHVSSNFNFEKFQPAIKKCSSEKSQPSSSAAFLKCLEEFSNSIRNVQPRVPKMFCTERLIDLTNDEESCAREEVQQNSQCIESRESTTLQLGAINKGLKSGIENVTEHKENRSSAVQSKIPLLTSTVAPPLVESEQIIQNPPAKSTTSVDERSKLIQVKKLVKVRPWGHPQIKSTTNVSSHAKNQDIEIQNVEDSKAVPVKLWHNEVLDSTVKPQSTPSIVFAQARLATDLSSTTKKGAIRLSTTHLQPIEIVAKPLKIHHNAKIVSPPIAPTQEKTSIPSPINTGNEMKASDHALYAINSKPLEIVATPVNAQHHANIATESNRLVKMPNHKVDVIDLIDSDDSDEEDSLSESDEDLPKLIAPPSHIYHRSRITENLTSNVFPMGVQTENQTETSVVSSITNKTNNNNDKEIQQIKSSSSQLSSIATVNSQSPIEGSTVKNYTETNNLNLLSYCERENMTTAFAQMQTNENRQNAKPHANILAEDTVIDLTTNCSTSPESKNTTYSAETYAVICKNIPDMGYLPLEILSRKYLLTDPTDKRKCYIFPNGTDMRKYLNYHFRNMDPQFDLQLEWDIVTMAEATQSDVPPLEERVWKYPHNFILTPYGPTQMEMSNNNSSK